ncbi:MAG: hypothetical protein R3A13_10100 [Bdellovibrionota bacterium]
MIDVEMSADMVAFALGKSKFSNLSLHIPEASGGNTGVMAPRKTKEI